MVDTFTFFNTNRMAPEMKGKMLKTRKADRAPRASMKYPIKGAEKICPRAMPVYENPMP